MREVEVAAEAEGVEVAAEAEGSVEIWGMERDGEGWRGIESNGEG